MRCTWERPTKSVTELARNVSLDYLPPVKGMTEHLKDPRQQGEGSELLEIGDAAVWVPGIVTLAKAAASRLN